MRKILERCPSCGSDLIVSEMRCSVCDTTVRGSWEPCRFCHLDAETLQFIEVFVKNRGNLKEMERELSESYWTLRARLNQAIEALGLEASETEQEAAESDSAAHARQSILQQVQEGKLQAADAVRRLAELGKE